MMKRLFKIPVIVAIVFGLMLGAVSPAFAIAPSDVPIVVYGETLSDDQKEEVRRLLEITDETEAKEYIVTGEDIAKYIDGDPNSRTSPQRKILLNLKGRVIPFILTNQMILLK